MTEEAKKIELEDKYRLLLLASQYQNINLQLQVLQRDAVTAQQQAKVKAQELADFRTEISQKYGVDLNRMTLDPQTDEFVPIPASGLPFQVQQQPPPPAEEEPPKGDG